MPHFIKTGFWEKTLKGGIGWLNLERFVENLLKGNYIPVVSTAAELEDTTPINLDNANFFLISGESTKVFTISYLGDDITLEVVLTTTSATYTFPESSLCVSEGIPSGDNTLLLEGVVGDKYIIGIKKIGNIHYIVSKNFGQ